MKITNFLVLALAAILALGLSACADQGPDPELDTLPAEAILSSGDLVAEGIIKPLKAVNLSFLARGVVGEVNVMIGDNVSKGDVLARLENASQAEAQLAAANLELIGTQQALDSLIRNGEANLAQAWSAYMTAQVARAEAEREWEAVDVNDIEDQIEDARADVQDLKAELEDAQDEFDRYKDLDRDNSRRRSAEDGLEQAQEEYNAAVRDLEELIRERDAVRAALDAAIAAEAEARYQWDLSKDGPNKDQLKLAEARFENAKVQVAAAESVLGNYVLTAPFDGVVADVAVETGEQVGPEARAISIMDASAWIVETADVTELEIVDVAVGQKVSIVPDALSDVSMNGIVTAISLASYRQSGDVLYTVYVAVENAEPRVKWGMTVELTFEPLE